uniref:DUF7730 domain-containing protein n=1 Tax=Mycena chlorophos TaxID=658473 RepID=A0ABQ0LL35_MYCCL|nr:predicted protein [Mycena chlorophos]
MVHRAARYALHGLSVSGYTLITLICCPCSLLVPHLRPTHCCGGTMDLGAEWAGQVDPPKPFPSKRIDIRSRPHATQPDTCFFLRKLPLELRLAIYEELFGGRHVRMLLIENPEKKRMVVKSTSHISERQISHLLPNALGTSLLRVCRQVYLEAHETLLSSNTFHISALQMGVVSSCGLGTRVGMPYIRHLNLFHVYRVARPTGLVEAFNDQAAASLIRDATAQISTLNRLTHLTITFTEVWTYDTDDPAANREDCEPDQLLNTSWGRLVVGIRLPTLVKVQMKILRQRYMAPIRRHGSDTWQRSLDERITGLMVGDGAQERYQRFLETAGKR